MIHSAGISSFSPSGTIPIDVVMPPLRIDWKACSTVRFSPIASNEKSTPPPPVRSRICSTGSPAEASTLCVAPRSRAVRSLCSSTSTAMIIRAPAMRAP